MGAAAAADMGSSVVRNTINLGNSIIGVSILAMPYCFERCGILLGSLLLLASGLLTRLTCHLLLKAAITARRRNYEFLAFHTYGPTGKLVVEIGVLGFLLGSCVAFFVVMGDLAPPLASDLFLLGGVLSPQRLRLVTLFLLGTCVGLPLGLLRNLDSLTSLSALSLAFYCLLVLKVFVDSFPVLWSGAWWDRVVLWRHENLLSVLPIFAMALSCQPQLFEIFDTVNEPSLKRMNSVVNGAVQMCSMVYITMGFFGYVAFSSAEAGAIPGNVLVRLAPSLWSEVLKMGFVATLVVSFPLCLFPCRTSLHSLLFKRGGKFHDPSYDYIPDGQFRLLTVLLVGATLATACLVPNIEVVLALTGSTIGTLICVIVPGMVFARVTTKDTNERLLAKFLSWAGLCLMIGCTVTTLSQVRAPAPATVRAPPGGTRYGQPAAIVVSKPPIALLQRADLKVANVSPLPDFASPPKVSPAAAHSPKAPLAPDVAPVEKRLEPPEPVEPVPREQVRAVIKPSPAKPEPAVVPPAGALPPAKEPLLDPEALKKEDREIEAATSSASSGSKVAKGAAQPLPAKGATAAPQAVAAKKQEALLVKIAQEQEVQKKMLEDLQRELKQELAKHKQEAPAAPQVPANNGSLVAAQPVAAQEPPPPPPAPVVQNVVAPAMPAQPSAKGPEAPREGPLAPLLPQVQKQEPPARQPDKAVLSNVPVARPAAQLPLQQKPPDPHRLVQSAGAVPADSQHIAQVQVQQQVQHQIQQQVIKDTQGIVRDALEQVPKVDLTANHLPPMQPVQLSIQKHPQQQKANLQPLIQLPNSQPEVVPDLFDKTVRNIVKPLDIILQRKGSGIEQAPVDAKVDSLPKPQLMGAQAPGQSHSVDSNKGAGDHRYARKPAQSQPEARREAASRSAVQRADDRPLVAKMSKPKDVKREAPKVDPRAAVQTDAPATQPPVVESKNNLPSSDLGRAAAVDSVPVEVQPRDSISPSLPSPARPEIVLKNEIRRK